MVDKVEYISNVKSCLERSAKFLDYVCKGLLIEYVPSKKGQKRYVSFVADLVKVTNDLESLVRRLEVVDMI